MQEYDRPPRLSMLNQIPEGMQFGKRLLLGWNGLWVPREISGFDIQQTQPSTGNVESNGQYHL